MQFDVSSVCFSFHKQSIQNFNGSVYFLLLESLQQKHMIMIVSEVNGGIYSWLLMAG
jgi:hypothetical protein